MSLNADDKLAIHELITDLYLKIDAQDAAGFASLFTGDGVFKAPYGDFKGHAAVQKFMADHIAAGHEDGVRHFVTNLIITPAGPNAVVKFYIIKLKVATGPGFVATADGTFQVSKTTAGWRIAEFALNIDKPKN
jgi:ketosteroid isomerase-like protein